MLVVVGQWGLRFFRGSVVEYLLVDKSERMNQQLV